VAAAGHGGWFAPYPRYAGAAFWLTDYVVSQTLMAAYQERAAELRAKGMPAPDRPWPPIGQGHSNTPSVLFNGMIAPITPFTIRGVI